MGTFYCIHLHPPLARFIHRPGRTHTAHVLRKKINSTPALPTSTFCTICLPPPPQAIEIRLLGLGDEPPRPVLRSPSYLGAGKARVEWSAGGVAVEAERDRDSLDHGGESTVSSPGQAAGSAGKGEGDGGVDKAAGAAGAAGKGEGGRKGEGKGEGEGGQQAAKAADGEQEMHAAREGASDRDQLALPPPPPPPPRVATFPVHKYVLQRSCLHHYSHTAASASSAEGGTGTGKALVENGGGGGNGGGVAGGAERFGESAALGNEGGWVTVHEEDDVGFIAASSSFVFVDSGLSAGKTYLYR